MKLTLEKIPGPDWRSFAYDAHRSVFGEHRPAEHDRCDFALVVLTDIGPVGYVTCKEMDAFTIYWQFGGAFPPGEKHLQVLQGIKLMAEWCKDANYKSIRFAVKNDNGAMLRIAIKLGAKIVGVRLFDANVFVEHRMVLQ